MLRIAPAFRRRNPHRCLQGRERETWPPEAGLCEAHLPKRPNGHDNTATGNVRRFRLDDSLIRHHSSPRATERAHVCSALTVIIHSDKITN
jgi:hypothetical protein